MFIVWKHFIIEGIYSLRRGESPTWKRDKIMVKIKCLLLSYQF
jgi:hypothetical protein